ncbi:MAG: hypothetical protein A3D44_00835 [Candidatus Staskawiczbacteria bacterium RIFCSPHIGHO2_02_FULL_42_22]|uniref:Peptidase C60 sortase A and B n=1 Tax=Candidatus Staskawiczbacteria bacterium RIFCSPHIGHO2_02_FULL_42_22 TaxID=1802207 RepID=A0A1G2I599_9BACT|nr:MAG: hypothetical protein A3D44_00835 [Candidatus Staskawiczbacteria bacterium RIFCSPHIGHO2_02_FULL_42_22]
MKHIILKGLLIFSLVLTASVAAVWYVNRAEVPYTNITSSENQQEENNQTSPHQNGIGPGLPVRLAIPSIGVDAKIIRVGLASDGSVDVPKGPSEVAWFQLGPRPGQKGSAVVTGHYGPWRSGAHSVFDNLHQLKQGDKIQVYDDQGNVLSFEVKKTEIYGPSESPPEVFAQNDGVHLNLITCQGDWVASQKTYTKRLVVFTELTPSKPL